MNGCDTNVKAALQINQWITDPKEQKRARESTVDRGLSPWLEKFLESNYEKPNAV